MSLFLLFVLSSSGPSTPTTGWVCVPCSGEARDSMVIKLLTELENKLSPYIVHVYMCLTYGRMIYSQEGDVFLYVLFLNVKEINQGGIRPSDTQKPWLTWETNTKRRKLWLSVCANENVNDERWKNEWTKVANQNSIYLWADATHSVRILLTILVRSLRWQGCLPACSDCSTK